MIYPDTFEHKIGFATLREWVAERCISTLGQRHTQEMTFSSDFPTVLHWLSSTSEMLSILNSDEEFPLGSVRDVSEILTHARVPGTFITAPELLDVRSSLAVMSDLAVFFNAHRHDNGHSDYPHLDETGIKIASFPLTVKSIDRIIDRFGNIRDNASPELREIRSQLSSTSGAIAS